jgi:Zn-finger nucleic acid-binding protein
MKCPACFNELTEIQAGEILVDVCHGGCGGIWFDAFELQGVQNPGVIGEPLLHLKRNDSISVDQTRKRQCPRCPDVKLHRHYFSAQRQVQVDKCPNCSGYWLDAGELAQIRHERAEAKTALDIQESVFSSEFIRYVYRLQIASQSNEATQSGQTR